MLETINLEQALNHIGSLTERSESLSKLVQTQKAQMAENQARLEKLAEYETKSATLQNTNEHLAM